MAHIAGNGWYGRASLKQTQSEFMHQISIIDMRVCVESLTLNAILSGNIFINGRHLTPHKLNPPLQLEST